MCRINELHKTDPANREIADRWKRKALFLNTKLLVVEDHDGRIAGKTKIDANVADHHIDHNAAPFTGTAPELIHVVAHTRLEDRGRGDFLTRTPTSTTGFKLVILQVSSVGPVKADSEVAVFDGLKCVWLSVKDRSAYCDPLNQWVTQFQNLNFATAEELAKIAKQGNRAAAADFESGYSHLLDLILPGRFENLLAFRLLCDAAKECAGQPSKSKAFGTELTIYAPREIGQWLEPFGESKAEKIPLVAAQIASGTVQERVKAVLENVGDTGKLIRGIGEFEDALAEQTASSKAGSKP